MTSSTVVTLLWLIMKREKSSRELKVYLQNYKLLDPANDKLPFLYWTPKMYKEPIEPRNIRSGKDCITSKLF